MKSKKKIGMTLIALTIILLSVVTSFAYFTSVINNENKTTAELNTATLALTFSDNDNGINERLIFGESVTKKFTITNTGTRDASLSLDWHQLINTYMDGSLSYNLKYATEETGEYIELIPETNMPTSNERLTQTLASEISVPAGDTYYYNLTITLNNLTDVNQTQDKDAVFNTKFSVDKPLKYRFYTLTVDPNGGTWSEFTAPQEYLLKNSEAKDIANPTRVGYTFDGWTLSGVSSILTDTTFTMGISNAKLIAQWKINRYTLTINPDGGVYDENTSVTMDYGSTTELSVPTRKGYTFTGRNVTGGRVGNNTFTLTEPDNASITATWQINNYKYIVYHNQMNIDGNGYTLVSADTDEGEAEYNSTVTPEVKTYTGFTSPTTKNLTIDEEKEYPPVKNKVDYNYDRNKYTLTINNDNETENITQEMYYGASVTLTIPNKTGYTFANWSAISGNLTENDFTMKDSDATVTANYTPNKYSVTFNANGGTVGEESKQIVYDSTYGTLPIPIYNNYIFLGWFTAPENGIQITESTKVNITEKQTLYAHWKIIGVDATLATLGITPKTGTPIFSSDVTIDEGVYSMPDNYGTSYYYRGNVTNNYVKFAGIYWRIVRINGDGSIRMAYDGQQAYANGTNNADRVAIENISWNTKNNDVKYTGYMYGGPIGVASTSKKQAQTNETDSEFKKNIDLWYKQNIEKSSINGDADLTKYLGDNLFCNDRSTSTKVNTWYTIDTTLGYAKNATVFGAFSRYIDNTGHIYSHLRKPSFLCSQKNDAFTKDDEIKGNGDLDYPIGTLTPDDYIVAGSGTLSYLYKGRNYWLSAPQWFSNDGYAYMFLVTGSMLNAGTPVNSLSGVVPVINLSPEYSVSLIGTGVSNNPYKLSGVE